MSSQKRSAPDEETPTAKRQDTGAQHVPKGQNRAAAAASAKVNGSHDTEQLARVVRLVSQSLSYSEPSKAVSSAQPVRGRAVTTAMSQGSENGAVGEGSKAKDAAMQDLSSLKALNELHPANGTREREKLSADHNDVEMQDNIEPTGDRQDTVMTNGVDPAEDTLVDTKPEHQSRQNPDVAPQPTPANISTPHRSELTAEERSALRRKESQRKADADEVRIVVGRGSSVEEFIVKQAKLETSGYLKGKAEYDSEEDAHYISSHRLARLEPDHFEAAAEYFDAGDYTPQIVATEQGHALKDFDKGDRALAQRLVVQSMNTIALANTLQMEHLRDLAIRKFKLLAPYSPEVFKGFVGMISGQEFGKDSREDELKQWALKYAAEHFFDLWEGDDLLKRFLETNPASAKKIWRLLAGLPAEEESRSPPQKKGGPRKRADSDTTQKTPRKPAAKKTAQIVKATLGRPAGTTKAKATKTGIEKEKDPPAKANGSKPAAEKEKGAPTKTTAVKQTTETEKEKEKEKVTPTKKSQSTAPKVTNGSAKAAATNGTTKPAATATKGTPAQSKSEPAAALDFICKSDDEHEETEEKSPALADKELQSITVTPSKKAKLASKSIKTYSDNGHDQDVNGSEEDEDSTIEDPPTKKQKATKAAPKKTPAKKPAKTAAAAAKDGATKQPAKRAPVNGVKKTQPMSDTEPDLVDSEAEPEEEEPAPKGRKRKPSARAKDQTEEPLNMKKTLFLKKQTVKAKAPRTPKGNLVDQLSQAPPSGGSGVELGDEILEDEE